MEKLIKKLKRTRMIGWIPKKDLLSLYAAADVVVVPSRWDEPFGLVTIEAMSSGTPVIGTKVGGIPEIITKKTGVLVNPKKPTQIAEAVLQRINDDGWLKKASKEARDLVKNKFSIKEMCENTNKIYKKILS